MRKDCKGLIKYFQWKNFVTLLILLVVTSCIFPKKLDSSKYFIDNIPPGTVKVGINLYYDIAEIDNLSWLEYMYWTKRVYGSNSTKYKTTYPDTLVWLETFPCLNDIKGLFTFRKDTFKTWVSYPLEYMRHPAYRNYPLVGITQKQAEDYSKWRSDRVFEFLLIKYGKIKINPGQDSATCFTSEKYFAGLYLNYKPDTIFKYYPCYRLPAIEEWKEVTYHKPFIDKNWKAKKKAKIIRDQERSLNEIQCDIIPCVKDTFLHEPTTYTYAFWPNDLGIYNLRGNVSEWTSEKDISMGGGWQDSKQTILKQDTFIRKSPNAYTGFRNVCEWKEWKK